MLTTNFDWGFELKEYRLFHEYFSCSLAEERYIFFLNINFFACAIYQLVYDVIDIKFAH